MGTIMKPPSSGAVVALVVGLAALTGLGLMAYTMLGSTNRADPSNKRLVALGAEVYRDHCAACHGANLEGQPEWRTRRPDGRLPAPPHDDSGHTWHHADKVLFDITKRIAGPDYQSDMPAFGAVLTDEQIWAVLAHIKSRWSPRSQARQATANERAKSR